MMAAKALAIALMVFLCASLRADDYVRGISDLDFSRTIENEEIVFAPFEWSEHKGVVWFKTFTTEHIYGQVNNLGMRNVNIYLQAPAKAGDGERYNQFISQSGVTDEKIRLYREGEFNCDVTAELGEFIKQVSGRDATVKTYGDSTILCQVSFSFVQGWEPRIEEFIASKNVFDLDVKLPLCEKTSPHIEVEPIFNMLLGKGVFTRSGDTYQANLFDALYEIAVLSTQSPELFGGRPRQGSQALFSTFELDGTTQMLSVAADTLNQTIRLCDERSVFATIAGEI